LTIGGTANNETVSAPLGSNIIYTATIAVTDAGGTTTKSVTFDTISPSYTWEAVDWDYTANGVTGLFIDNPQTNQYAGLPSTQGVDCYMPNLGSGNSNYRPQGLESEGCGDSPLRLAYINTTNKDYDNGFTDGGGWANYTRHFPKGLYNVYARLADGNGAQNDCCTLSVVASASGNAQLLDPQGGGTPYSFSVKSTGWQNYGWYPLLDNSKSLIQFTNDGTQATLQVLVTGGNYNGHFFMLVPAEVISEVATSTEFTNMYPDGATQFQPSSNLTFTVTNSAGINPGGIVVLLSGTNLLGEVTNSSVTVGNGLTASGPETNLTLSLPLASNTTYSVFIQTTDLGGGSATTSWTFDTISPVYTWEAEDFDYSEGQYVDNPQTNAYYGTDGIFGYDCFSDAGSTNHGTPYRQANEGGPETEGCGDVPRVQYTNTFPNNINPLSGIPYQDYDCGFNDNNDWENYTRHYPNGTFNIYVRGANGGGGTGSGGMELVTSGVGTDHQTVSNLGTFAYPSTGNWQKYVFSPLKDGSGNLVKVTFNGTEPETLRAIAPSSGNMNFFMLMPYDTTLPTVTGLYPDGLAFFEQTNRLSFTASSSLGIPQNKIVVIVNGVNVASDLTFTGSANSWFVSYPLQNNNSYSVSITVTANGGAQYNQSVVFDTFSPNNYTWEPGDFDYTGTNGVPGQYIDNPQVDAYNGLGATPGIDELEVTAGANLANDLYRADNGGPTAALAGDLLIDTQPGGDLPRAQFGTNATWLLQWFGYGDFANYTRHYPAGSYNVYARFKNGGSATTQETLWEVTNGWGTTNQQTEFLGAWTLPSEGWGTWYWAELMTTNATPTPVVLSLNGSTNTLQLGSSLVQDGQNCNVGFFMLVPVPSISLTATLSGGQINISFPTTSGKSYQLVFKSSLSATTWTPVGSAIAGTGSVQSVQYAPTGNAGFYTIEIK